MNINLGGARTRETGYGRMTHELMRSLDRLGVHIDDYAPNERDERGMPRWGTTDRPVHRNGLWMTAPSQVRGWWKGQRVHVLTMWEATVLPPGFRETFHEIENLFVPSQQNVELFSRFHDGVHLVHLGVDPEVWHYRERPEPAGEFRFLTCGQGRRKGIDVAVGAFRRVFGDFQPSPSHPRPVLTVKDRYAADQRWVEGEGIRHVSGTISAEDEVELYASAHAFLGLSRGEGWGMMPFQALAQGCPTILTDAHGQAEFSHFGVPISSTMTRAEPFIFGDAGEWWEPDLDEVCEAMWDVYVSYDAHRDQAREAAATIAGSMTWDDAAQKLINIIGPASLSEPPLVAPGWYEPTVQLFEIVTNQDCSYEVNGVVYRFQRGERYYEFGDLKRMMYENGRLDPVCLRDPHESGLLPWQLERLEEYRASHSRCPTCHQILNTDETLDFEDEDARSLIP